MLWKERENRSARLDGKDESLSCVSPTTQCAPHPAKERRLGTSELLCDILEDIRLDQHSDFGLELSDDKPLGLS